MFLCMGLFSATILAGRAPGISLEYRRKMIPGRKIQLHSHVSDGIFRILQQNLGGIDLQIGNVSMGRDAHLLLECLVEARRRKSAVLGNALQGGILCQVSMNVGESFGNITNLFLYMSLCMSLCIGR